jgi:osmotically inducible lipoprotein OsmB
MIELTQAEIDGVAGADRFDVYSIAIGASVGAAMGFLVAGPVGAAAGAISGGVHGALVAASD